MLLYKKISDELLAQINTARLRPGDRLPSERKLMRHYDASDTSVRRALAILRDHGYIEKKHGSGNYVLDKVQVGGYPGKAKVVVAGYGQFGRHVGMGALLETLGQRFDGVRTLAIDTPVIATEQLRQLLRDYNCPIILLNSRNQTAEMAAAGLLVPLENSPLLNEAIDRIPDNLKWRFSGLDGIRRYYSMPYLYITSCLAINEGLAAQAGLDIESPPATWDELLEWCRRFGEWKKHSGAKNVFATFGSHRNFAGMNSRAMFFMAANGMPFSMEESELRRALREYFTLLEKLIAGGHVETVGLQSPDPFVSGKYLFSLQAHSWLPRDIERFRPDLKVRLIPMPLPAAGRPRFSVGGTSLLSIATPADRELDLAAVLPVLRAMLEPEWHGNLAYNLGGGPADPAAYRQLLEKRPELNAFYDAIFSTIEPHCPADDALIEQLDEIIMKRFNDPSRPLTDMVEEYAAFYQQTLATRQ